MSRGGLEDLGEGLDEGTAAVIVIGESRIDQQIENATKRARKLLQRQLDADADELKRQIDAEAERLKAGGRGVRRGGAGLMLRPMTDMPAGTIGFEAIGEVENDDWEEAVEPVLRAVGPGSS